MGVRLISLTIFSIIAIAIASEFAPKCRPLRRYFGFQEDKNWNTHGRYRKLFKKCRTSILQYFTFTQQTRSYLQLTLEVELLLPQCEKYQQPLHNSAETWSLHQLFKQHIWHMTTSVQMQPPARSLAYRVRGRMPKLVRINTLWTYIWRQYWATEAIQYYRVLVCITGRMLLPNKGE